MSWVGDKVESFAEDPLGSVITVGTLGMVDGGDITGSNAAQAAEEASAAQQAAAQNGIELTQQIYNQNQLNQAPFRELGVDYLDQFKGFINQPNELYAGLPDPNNVQATPGFQFQLNEGFDQIQNSAAAKKKLNSGGTLEGMERYRQGLAATHVPQYTNMNLGVRNQLFNERLTNRNQRFNELLTPIQMGQNTSVQQANQGQAHAGQVSNLLGQQANAAAAGMVGAQNAQTAGINNLLGMGSAFLGGFL